MSSHGLGAIEVVQGLLGPLVPVFALVTQFGDVWFLLVLFSTLYLTGGRLPGFRGRIDRQRVAYVLALAIGGLALTVGLKLLIGLPRPPSAGTPVGGGWLPEPAFDLYASAVYADGLGFPSGHALGSTVAYGGLALVMGDSLSRRRLLIAAVVAGFVGFSRVAIGVHHLSSVLGGFAIGVAYLALVTRVTDNGRRVGLAFLLAVFAGVFALFGGGYERDAVLVLGLALGGRLTWQVTGKSIQAAPTAASTREAVRVAGVGLPLVGGIFVITGALEPPLPVALILAGLIVAVLLAVPVVGPLARQQKIGE